MLNMSIPHSKVLSVSKGFGLGAELHSNSPSSNQTQVVNVNINKDKDPAVVSYGSEQPKPNVEPAITDTNPPPEAYIPPIDEINPYRGIQVPSNDPSTPKDEALESNVRTKDSIIEAYSVLLSIVENNPLKVNQYIVAKADDLRAIIQLLTESDTVQINCNLDVDCHCLGSTKYSAVDKIYVTKNGETFNFKYSYPEANKILDDHHVSVKFVC